MDLVFEKKSVLTEEMCKEIIEKFENDERKMPGNTAAGLIPEMKNSMDLVISRFDDWDKITNLLDIKLKEVLRDYITFVQSKFPSQLERHIYEDFILMKQCGFQIQKSGYYRWHNDELNEYNRSRVITFIFYLNTIEEGGETSFYYKKVKPEMGKVVLFPATWDYPHCGNDAPNKYIITGWLWKNVLA